MQSASEQVIPAPMVEQAGELKPCPFCGVPPHVAGGVNPYGRCDTEGCWMHERALSITIEDPRQVAQWNTRPAPAETEGVRSSTDVEREWVTIADRPCETAGLEDMEPGCCAPCRARDAMAKASTPPADAGMRDIAAERQRQIAVKGWSPEHDDAHDDRSLAKAAACYARGSRQYWPWERAWWKPRSHRANLVRAGALIVAEIARLDRIALNSQAHQIREGDHE